LGDVPEESPPSAWESNPTRSASNPARIATIHAIRTITSPLEGVNSHLGNIRRACSQTPPRNGGDRLPRPSADPRRLGCPPQGKKSRVVCVKGPPGRRLHCLSGRGRFKRLVLPALLAPASLAALSLAASAPPAGAVVTIGSNLARVPNSAANYIPRPTFSNVSLPSARQAPGGLSSPVNGTVVRWRIRVGDSTRITNLRIIRRLGSGLFTGAGTSASVTPRTAATTSYRVQLPIRIGDYVGLDCCDPGIFEPDAEFFVTGNAAVRNEWQPRLADNAGGRAPLRTNGYEIALNADINPISTFTLDAITRNKNKGTATITANLPNPGELTGSGRGVNAAVISRKVRAPGRVRLLIKAKGKKKRKLNSTGKVRVRPEITYTPTGGDANTRSVKLKLIRR
jgi:hypothetical protein